MSDVQAVDESTTIMNNPHFKWDWRKRKKIIRKRSDNLEQKGFFVCCHYHPCKISGLSPYHTSNPWSLFEASVEGKSLINGQGASCSMYHCAPEALTESEAMERVAYWKEHGELAHMQKYIYKCTTPEQEAEVAKWFASFNAEWRNDNEQA